MLLLRRCAASSLSSAASKPSLALRSTASLASLSRFTPSSPPSSSLLSPSSLLSLPSSPPSSFLKPTWSSLSSSSSAAPFRLQQPLRRYTSSSGSASAPQSEKEKRPLSELTDEEASKLSLTERAKYLTRKYGWVALGTYSTVYVTFFASIALAIQLGVDVQGVIGMLGLTQWIGPEALDPRAGVLVMAFVLNKFTSPIRIVIVASITPYVARVLRAFRATKAK